MTDLDAAGIAAALNRREVDYVVIGAFAAIAQRAPIPATRDIDFTPARGVENLTRLSAALTDLGTRIRVPDPPEGLPFAHNGDSLGAVLVWNLICSLGEFDLCFSPAGFDGGYEELVGRSHVVTVGTVTVRIADLADVIASKEAAGRPKDLRVLPALHRHLQQRDISFQ